VDAVCDKATYVEHVWLRKTKREYTIQLTTTGTAPEIKAISPPLRDCDAYTPESAGD
jgi:hypothetical protein